ncbi:MAG: hypothetical protein NTY99_01895 [DPANN group archaeon]|nr:hypothetical protein [DPANN group archaeon]
MAAQEENNIAQQISYDNLWKLYLARESAMKQYVFAEDDLAKGFIKTITGIFKKIESNEQIKLACMTVGGERVYFYNKQLVRESRFNGFKPDMIVSNLEYQEILKENSHKSEAVSVAYPVATYVLEAITMRKSKDLFAGLKNLEEKLDDENSWKDLAGAIAKNGGI